MTTTPAPAARDPFRTWVWLVILAWAAMNAVLLWLYHDPTAKILIGDEFDYNRRALALLQGQPVIELFIWPPAQNAFIAVIYAIFGPDVLWVQCVQIVLLLLCAGMLARLWGTLDRRAAALWAATLFLLNPSTLAYAHWLWPEVTHLVCLLGALVVLLTVPRWPRAGAFVAGALIGLALLFKSLLGGLWPVFFLFFLRRRESGTGYAVIPAMAFAAGLLVATGPTLWKGYVETGRPLIADSSVYNLQVGLRDTSRSDYIDEAGLPALTAFIDSASTPQQRNAASLQKVREIVAERGLLDVVVERLSTQYFRLFSAKTLLISQIPGPACAGRLGAYHDAPWTSVLIGVAEITHGLTLVLFAFGVCLWRRWREPLLLFFVVFLAYQLALYLGLHVMERYVFQMLPVMCAFGGSVIAAMFHRGQASPCLAVSPLRLVSGLILAVILLSLAWLGPVLDGQCQ
jgi:hypothetical protein